MAHIANNTRSSSSSAQSSSLTTLPVLVHGNIFSFLNCTELLRLSACCHLLRNTIRNDNVLWQALYKHEFLSGAYQKKEWEFIFWCVRTNPNTTSMPIRRSDIIKHVDCWYDVYRRRIVTEYNWRHGYSNIIEIAGGLTDSYRKKDAINKIFAISTGVILRVAYWVGDIRIRRWFDVEYSAHSDLKHSNGKIQQYSHSTLPKRNPIHGNDVFNLYLNPSFMGDHYVPERKQQIQEDSDSQTMFISIRGNDYESTHTTIDIPSKTAIKMVDGNWALLRDIIGAFHDYNTTRLMVVDMENQVKCPGHITGHWDTMCFYETNNKSAIVYTARFKEEDRSCIEWALHKFSSNACCEQLRSGWCSLPVKFGPAFRAQPIQNSRVAIQFRNYDSRKEYYIIHSVASSGETCSPKAKVRVSKGELSIPLLKAGLNCRFDNTVYVHCMEELADNRQFMYFQEICRYNHIIGSLYSFVVREDGKQSLYLVDIDKREKQLVIDDIIGQSHIPNYSMIGSVAEMTVDGRRKIIINEYGAL